MKIKLTFLSLALSAIVFNCTKEELTTDSLPVTQTEKAITGTEYSTRTINFTRANGSYSESNADSDFGNTEYYNIPANASIVSNALRVKMPANTWSTSGGGDEGLKFKTQIVDASEIELSYRIKFDANFKWSSGGKAGLGLVIGKGSSGCDAAITDGASVRVTWDGIGNKDNELNEAYFKPYFYYVDRQNTCGDSFLNSSSTNPKLKKNVWYTIKIRVKVNTGSNSNGTVRVSMTEAGQSEYVLFSDNSFRWTNTSTTNVNRLVKKISFDIFRGGADPKDASTQNDYVYIDDVTWTKIN